jgi:hypothetical protein
MSHPASLPKKFLLLLYVVLWSVLLAAAGVWLTEFLIGTLSDPRMSRDTHLARTKVFDSVVALTEKKVVRYLGEWEMQEPRLPGHFHHIGRWYEADKADFCVKCHGQTPHSNSPQMRAFLNMHTLFISCEVCHVCEGPPNATGRIGEPEQGAQPNARLAWSNITDGRLCPSPDMSQMPWGEYGMKIVPVKDAPEGPRPVTFDEEEAFAAEYFKRRDKLTDQQKVLANQFIHRRCTATPVRCSDCHSAQQAFLPYVALGYSPERAAFLMSDEVVDLVRRYETFHMPKLLNPEDQGIKSPGEEKQ